MSSCMILGGKTVFDLLTSLTRAETFTFRNEIAKSLISLTVDEERKFQPAVSTVKRPDGRMILFRPFTSSTGPGIKIIVDSVSNPAATNITSSTSSPPGLHGIVAVCDHEGIPKGLINADEITAYRIAMSVMIPLTMRSDVTRVVVFGAGDAARWHLDIALRLKGANIRHVTVINRTLKNADDMVRQVRQLHEDDFHSDTLSPKQEGYEEKVRAALASASVVCCATPSSQPLFPAVWLQLEENPRPCFVSGVGSWQPEMMEIDPELINLAAAKGAMLTDDRDAALKSCGEFLHSDLHGHRVIEVGEILDADDPSRLSSSSSVLSSTLSATLNEGLVVYKSIGVSLTDLAASNVLLELAKSRGKGTLLSDF